MRAPRTRRGSSPPSAFGFAACVLLPLHTSHLVGGRPTSGVLSTQLADRIFWQRARHTDPCVGAGRARMIDDEDRDGEARVDQDVAPPTAGRQVTALVSLRR